MGWFFGSAFSYFVVFGGVFGFRAGNWVLCSDFSSRVLVECIFWVFFFFYFMGVGGVSFCFPVFLFAVSFCFPFCCCGDYDSALLKKVFLLT